MEPRGTILGVWAHPDDETYLTAGLMAAAVQRGDRVVCVTATKGEAGSQDEERWPSDSIAEVRAGELMEALGILGVSDHHWLGYIDGRCHEVDDEEATGRIARVFESVQPDSVFTFGPDGDTGHLDHIAVSRWTTLAFDRSAKAGAKLYYPTVSPSWAEKYVPALRDLNVYGDNENLPVITPQEEIAISFRLGPELADLKMKALSAQVSQTEGFISAVGQEFYRAALIDEMFRLAASK